MIKSGIPCLFNISSRESQSKKLNTSQDFPSPERNLVLTLLESTLQFLLEAEVLRKQKFAENRPLTGIINIVTVGIVKILQKVFAALFRKIYSKISKISHFYQICGFVSST